MRPLGDGVVGSFSEWLEEAKGVPEISETNAEPMRNSRSPSE